MSEKVIPSEFWACASEISLENVCIKRHAAAANLRKEVEQILEEAIQMEVTARLAQIVKELRPALLRASAESLEDAKADGQKIA